jgi:hypothetical protein
MQRDGVSKVVSQRLRARAPATGTLGALSPLEV